MLFSHAYLFSYLRCRGKEWDEDTRKVLYSPDTSMTRPESEQCQEPGPPCSGLMVETRARLPESSPLPHRATRRRSYSRCSVWASQSTGQLATSLILSQACQADDTPTSQEKRVCVIQGLRNRSIVRLMYYVNLFSCHKNSTPMASNCAEQIHLDKLTGNMFSLAM